MPKLKTHVLPRIKALLLQGNHSPADHAPVAGAAILPTPRVSDHDRLLFKLDRMYSHNIVRVNYTTYDVHRKQDTVNSNTYHRDIMVLAENNDDSAHPFLYARVIGIFHVNAVYTGGAMVDYQPRKVEILWVRWFELDMNAPAGSWSNCKLDRLRFPPMANEDAFGFLDPADVVRGCHIIPAFASGKRYLDGRGISPCAKDSKDWRSYYVNRCVTFSALLSFESNCPLLALLIAICLCGSTGGLL